MADKLPFDIDRAIQWIRQTVRRFPKAAMFALSDEGFATPFEQLVACIVSIRTRDEVTLVSARRLFGLARTPGEMYRLTTEQIDAAVGASTFHEAKARQIREICRRIVAKHAGELPCEEAVLLSFAGVGPKCANLVLGIACGQARIGVDIHVHRITNRWGYVRQTTPERTMLALEEKLPKEYWVEINRLLVPFGKHVCTGSLPRCSTCPVLEMCRQVGVTAHR
jgi:endonuclease-3